MCGLANVAGNLGYHVDDVALFAVQKLRNSG
jgi:hypothetical protein